MINSKNNRVIPLSCFLTALAVLVLIGCPILPLNKLNNPVDPEAKDFQGGKYLIAFDSQGGSAPEPAEKVVYGGEVYGELPSTSKADLLFGGWWTEPAGNGMEITSATTVLLTEDHFLYAMWTANTYTVTLNRQNGTGGTSSVTGTYGAAMPAASAPTRTGYTFEGYYTSTGGSGTQYYAADMSSARDWDLPEDTTLYAKWIANTYTVTLNRQNGTGGDVTVTATYDAAMPVASAPTRIGYSFGGYYTGTGGTGTQYYTADMSSASNWDLPGETTLYAKWTANTSTVTLNKQNGTGGDTAVTATYDAPMPAASAPTRTGYVFGGYYTGTGGSGTQYYTAGMSSARNWDLAEDTTLYAKWVRPSIPLIYVEGGTFQMGNPSGGFSDERPVHSVTLDSFYIGTYEVTQDIYEEVMGSNPSNWKGPRLPVERVTWFDAVAFANALSVLDGLDEVYTIDGTTVSVDWSKRGYRLPTEAEWEYAARGGKESQGYTYAGSNTVGDVAWYRDNSSNKTHEVGTKAANELGLYDMSGNVYEWCWDWHGGYTESAKTNPTGPSTGSLRVLRGGRWNGLARYVRSANRGNGSPSNRLYVFGFRLVLPAD